MLFEGPSFRKIRIFLASPQGLEREREVVREKIESLNTGIANEFLLTLELWEGNQVTPAVGRPQGVTLEQLPPDQWDLFIGILWHRFGTPSGGLDPGSRREFLSGTEEEFAAAHRRYLEQGRPDIMLYRLLRPVAPDRINPIQLGQVHRFFAEIEGKVHYQSFSTKDEFRERIDRDLTRFVLKNKPVHREEDKKPFSRAPSRSRPPLELDLPNLEIRGPFSIEPEVDLWEAIDETSDDPARHIFSCVAICRKDLRRGWPAVGGEHWLRVAADDPATRREIVRHTAAKLAFSMYIKTAILRHSAAALGEGLADLFRWQGGKGVIWTPPGIALDPHRLHCQGALIDHLNGEYLGSVDAGVGKPHLGIIAEKTPHVIGLGYSRDTGEAVAWGLLAGLKQAVREQETFGTDPDRPLEGVPILVIGLGKVGFPLLLLLHEEGAKVFAFDAALRPDPEAVQLWCDLNRGRGVSVETAHVELLSRLQQEGRLLASEEEALRHPEAEIISPNGGDVEWLVRKLSSGATRTEAMVENRKRNGNLKLILGGTNHQLPMLPSQYLLREATLAALAEAGILWVPDPIVNPGGVIAVSHELAGGNNFSGVNEIAARLVERSVQELFSRWRRRGGAEGLALYSSFEDMIREPWA